MVFYFISLVMKSRTAFLNEKGPHFYLLITLHKNTSLFDFVFDLYEGNSINSTWKYE